VTRKKPKPRSMTIGVAECTTIKTVPAVKVSSVFVSRCDPSTTIEDVRSFLNEKNWQISLVEKLKAKYGTYSSFRIDLVRTDQPESFFLKPEHWPADMLVKRFNRTKPGLFQKSTKQNIFK